MKLDGIYKIDIILGFVNITIEKAYINWSFKEKEKLQFDIL